MKKKLFTLLTALTKSGSKNSGWRKKRTSKVNKILSRAAYATNYNNVQSLGVGSATCNIEYNFNQIPQVNTQYGVNIGRILTGSKEFIDKMTHYRYFKILGLVVVFEPSYIGTGAEFVRVQLNFNSNETDEMDTEDSTKIVPLYRTKKIVLKYMMPNLQCLGPHGYLNYTAWLTRDIYNNEAELPGDVWFSTTMSAQYALTCKIILRVGFRGSVSISSSAQRSAIKIKVINKGESAEGEEKEEVRSSAVEDGDRKD